MGGFVVLGLVYCYEFFVVAEFAWIFGFLYGFEFWECPLVV